jgi:hypothetical protein
MLQKNIWVRNRMIFSVFVSVVSAGLFYLLSKDHNLAVLLSTSAILIIGPYIGMLTFLTVGLSTYRKYTSELSEEDLDYLTENYNEAISLHQNFGNAVFLEQYFVFRSLFSFCLVPYKEIIWIYRGKQAQRMHLVTADKDSSSIPLKALDKRTRQTHHEADPYNYYITQFLSRNGNILVGDTSQLKLIAHRDFQQLKVLAGYIETYQVLIEAPTAPQSQM